MPLSNFTKFHLTNNIGKAGLTQRVETSLVMFLNWALLELGAFSNVDHSTSNIQGVNRSLLRKVDNSNKIYESIKKDWVYETGLDYSIEPYVPEIKVNGTTVTTGFTIDYKLGRVIFSTALNNNDIVTAKFTYRNIQVVVDGESPWWKEIQYNPLNTDAISFSKENTGNFLINSKYRIQTPLILIETVTKRDSEPYEIGNVAQIVNFPVLIHIVSDNKIFRDKIVDILSPQKGQYFINLNIDSISLDNKWPLNFNGTLNPNRIMYPELIANYQYNKSFILDSYTSSLELPNPELYCGTVRWDLEILLGTA